MENGSSDRRAAKIEHKKSTTNSPLKNGVGNFSFGSSAQFSADDHSARPNSVSVQPPHLDMTALHNESPPVGRLAPKLSLSSTPGTMGGNAQGDGATTAFSAEALSPDQSQQMALMQQLAAQLGLANGGNTEGERNALFEQIFGNGGLHLAELMGHAQSQQQPQQSNDPNSPSLFRCSSPSSVRSPPVTLSSADFQSHQNVPSSSSSSSSSSFACAQCAKHFASQSALFQHQLAVHIGDSEAQPQPQQSASGSDTQSTVNALAMLAAAGINGGSAGTQQQLFGQLLGSNPFPQGTTPSLMFNNSSAFGAMNPTDFDGAAMLAKLSAEFAAVAQAQHGQGGAISGAATQSAGGQTQNGGMGRGQTPAPSNKPPPQKRQYSSTSKNFCDMLKMHNIIIDENKQLIANIDTLDKERKGEVKFRSEAVPCFVRFASVASLFRCDICHASMNTREELKLHKRESHGMHAGAGSQSTPLSGTRTLSKASSSSLPQSATAATDTTESNQQQQAKMAVLSSFATPASHFSAIEHQQPTQRRMTASEGTAAGANDENNQPLGEQTQRQPTRDSAVEANPMKQLLSLIGSGGAGGDDALPPSLVSGARLLKTAVAMNTVKKEAEDEQLGHRIADANNNATNCRFCGLCLEEEGQLQLHQLMEHPNEYMAELQPTMDLQHSESREDKLIDQVALQMAEANTHHHHHLQHHHQQRQFQQQRKTSVSSSGASSSSAVSFGDIAAGPPQQQQKTKKVSTHPRGEDNAGDDDEGTGHQCPQCKRMYKSAQKMERHQRIVHHNFVSKLSPTKRSIISPKKVAKLLNAFACQKCRRRFSSRVELDEHVLSHIQSERLKREEMGDERPQGEEEGAGDSGTSPQVKRPKMGAEGEEDEVMAHQHHRDGIAPEGDKVLDMDAQTEAQRTQKRTTKGTGGGEKHSHTSGSTSPVSVQAGSSAGAMPEGFAHPLLDHAKPFVLQSFTLRPVSPQSNSQLPDELVAYLPVRSTVGQPVRVTFELHPTPHVDQQVQHL